MNDTLLLNTTLQARRQALLHAHINDWSDQLVIANHQSIICRYARILLSLFISGLPLFTDLYPLFPFQGRIYCRREGGQQFSHDRTPLLQRSSVKIL